MNYWKFAYRFIQTQQRTCITSILERPELLSMVKEKKKVDVVITMGTCGSYVAQLLDAKIVKFSATGPFDAVLVAHTWMKADPCNFSDEL